MVCPSELQHSLQIKNLSSRREDISEVSESKQRVTKAFFYLSVKLLLKYKSNVFISVRCQKEICI